MFEFPNKPHRLGQYDYSDFGYYSITICTKDRYEDFGMVKDNKIVLSLAGFIVRHLWPEISRYFTNVALDSFVVMPNHIHGIIVIKYKLPRFLFDARRSLINQRPTGEIVGTNIKNNPMKMPAATLGFIVRWFKAKSSYIIRKSFQPDFSWQPRFYDHIIRNEYDLNRTREYLRLNPERWHGDRNNINKKQAENLIF